MAVAVLQNRDYRFSTETRNELRSILGDDASSRITPQLERILSEYQHLCSARARVSRADVERSVRQLITSFETALRCIDGISLAVRTFLGRPMTIGQAFGSRPECAWDKVLATRAYLRESIQSLELRPKPKRGRRWQSERVWLALRIALELKTCGVPTRTSRDGKFGRVLSAVLNDFHGESAPDDVFPLIKTAGELARHPAAELYLRMLRLDSVE